MSNPASTLFPVVVFTPSVIQPKIVERRKLADQREERARDGRALKAGAGKRGRR